MLEKNYTIVQKFLYNTFLFSLTLYFYFPKIMRKRSMIMKLISIVYIKQHFDTFHQISGPLRGPKTVI